ncbi:alpha/beta fold hydrolase [Ottowia sp.]|uniref:alpha/beta fold hydrolase n=1 Tax=Ottowia sp. TaxID=1898956 RepID=UPI003A83F45B
MKIKANGIDIEVEDTSGAGEPVLLIMGLGGQLVHFPASFVSALVQAGYRVVRFDNRDAGLSRHFSEAGTPNTLGNVLRYMTRMPVKSAYTLHDMAHDALGVLDALGIARAHVFGVSMGGMIAQRLALAAPERCATLTSVMSSSGARDLPGPRAKAWRAMAAKPKTGHGAEKVVQYYLNFFSTVGGPAFPLDEAELRAVVLHSMARNHDPVGTFRQMAAIMADTTRADELPRLRCPTLVLHGDADPLVRIECGQDTARRIPSARWVVIPGGGHDASPAAFAAYLRHWLPFAGEHPAHANNPQPVVS